MGCGLIRFFELRIFGGGSSAADALQMVRFSLGGIF